MKINLKKSLTLLIGTIVIAVFASFLFGDKFISSGNAESVSNISLSADLYVMYPELIKKINAMPESFNLAELRKLEAEYGVDLNINLEDKKFFGVMVNYENIKEYGIGMILGLLASLLFFLKYLKKGSVDETQEEKLGSNFLIYLNLYVTAPIIIFILHILDMQLGWTSSGVFIPIGLVSGAFLSIILLLVTIAYFIKTAKNIMSTWALIVEMFAPFLLVLILLIIYPLYFAVGQYL